VRISAAKKLRDGAERIARFASADQVDAEDVVKASRSLAQVI
jgi:hypothetical protein